MIEIRLEGKDRVMKLLQKTKGLGLTLVKRLSNQAETIMKSEVLSGQVLNVRTGRLRNSIGHILKEDSNGITGVIGSGVRTGKRVAYADIHATGGIIRAKKGKYLAIPLQGALTRSRSQLRGDALSARDFKNTFFHRTRAGNLLIMQRGSQGVIPLFVLKKQVKIPQRNYILATEEKLGEVSGSVFEKAMKELRN